MWTKIAQCYTLCCATHGGESITEHGYRMTGIHFTSSHLIFFLALIYQKKKHPENILRMVNAHKTIKKVVRMLICILQTPVANTAKADTVIMNSFILYRSLCVVMVQFALWWWPVPILLSFLNQLMIAGPVKRSESNERRYVIISFLFLSISFNNRYVTRRCITLHHTFHTDSYFS